MAYTPLNISSNAVGLVQNRQNFLLPADAYPKLVNAYVWREQLKRKQGASLVGRLRRLLTSASLIGPFRLAGPGVLEYSIPDNLGISATEPYANIEPGNITPIIISIGAPINQTLTDTTGTGIFVVSGSGPIGSATINYAIGHIYIVFTIAATNSFGTFSGAYYPTLPVMGIRTLDTQNSINDETIFFDTKYAYNYDNTSMGFVEFLPGTTWTGADNEFFWSTNYFVGTGNFKIFWATNFSVSGDPIRYCNGQPGTQWVNFSPVIDASGNTLNQCLALLPFRGRLVAFNTRETTGAYSNRIRWAAIGTPFTVTSAIVSTVKVNAWRDDIRGQGGFLDIPTSEDIVCVGFVRDNVVIYCERSTWQLRYTGRSIAPFQIERVNSELGSSSTFSAIQFDTSLVSIGDKGIIECDSYKSERIDIKIPDLVFHFNNNNNGTERVHGARDFQKKLAYWTYCSDTGNGNYPDSRLVYNYENDSWAIFSDSLTALGQYQVQDNPTWLDTSIPWIEYTSNWIDQPVYDPDIVGGNQQGFILNLDMQSVNDASLFISAITANITLPTVITSPLHNMQTGFVILISGIPTGTPFANLNGGIFGIVVLDINTFQLMIYNPVDGEFTLAQLDNQTGYIGGGVIAIRDNFLIQSKKFNFAEEGQSIQIGYIDILMSATQQDNPGQISLNVYLDYNDEDASNTAPANVIQDGSSNEIPDDFFNTVIPTCSSVLNTKGGTKFWQRVFCPTRANFLTLEYTFNNLQMSSLPQELDVQIDSQVIYQRRAGRMTQI